MMPKSQFSLSLVLLLAWRNLWRNKRRTYITAISIGVSFAFAIMVQALNDGAHNGMIRNAIKLGNGHLSVQPNDYLQSPANHKFIADSTSVLSRLQNIPLPMSLEPRISLNLLATTAHNSLPASLEGGVIDHDSRLALFKEFLIAGHWLEPNTPNNVVIGYRMANKLKVQAGQKIVFMAANEVGDTIAYLGRVAGIFRSNVDELDNFLVLSTLGFSQKFLREDAPDAPDPVTRISVQLPDLKQVQQLQILLNQRLAGSHYEAVTWQQMMPELLQFIAVDDAGGYIFLLLILIMIVFGVANTVFMSVLERSREFALLHVVGLSRFNLTIVVILESVFMALISLCIGWFLAILILLYFSHYGLDITSLTENVTQIANTIMDPVVYTELSLSRGIQFSGVAFLSTVLVGVYPAIRAGRVAPVRALQS